MKKKHRLKFIGHRAYFFLPCGCRSVAAGLLRFRSRATALSQPSDCTFAAERLQVRSRAAAISQQSDCDRRKQVSVEKNWNNGS
ncbi:MAG: hypothetical protein LBD89_00265 [Tannerellaceae bacterium]|nr:hypothetical protein [Tannerellaceae bacterium]